MTGPIKPQQLRKAQTLVAVPRVLSGPMGERYRYVNGSLEVSSGGAWIKASTVPVSMVEALDDLMTNPTEEISPLRQALATAGLFPSEIDGAIAGISDAALQAASTEELVLILKQRGAREFGSANHASNALGSQARRILAL